QHQVVASIDIDRVHDLGPARLVLLAVGPLDLARRSHVDDVVVVLDGRIGADRLRLDVESTWRRPVVFDHGGRRLPGTQAGNESEEESQDGQSSEIRGVHGVECSIGENSDRSGKGTGARVFWKVDLGRKQGGVSHYWE